MSLAEANQKVHPVDTQWHFPTMTENGYLADTKEATGFVRTYQYTNPTNGHTMTVTTGAHADYWRDPTNNAGGYWIELEPHLKSLQK